MLIKLFFIKTVFDFFFANVMKAQSTFKSLFFLPILLGPVESDTVLLTARHRCNISSIGAALPGRNDAVMGPAGTMKNLNTACIMKNLIFDLIILLTFAIRQNCVACTIPAGIYLTGTVIFSLAQIFDRASEKSVNHKPIPSIACDTESYFFS